jgi:hypothetical protein
MALSTVEQRAVSFQYLLAPRGVHRIVIDRLLLFQGHIPAHPNSKQTITACDSTNLAADDLMMSIFLLPTLHVWLAHDGDKLSQPEEAV